MISLSKVNQHCLSKDQITISFSVSLFFQAEQQKTNFFTIQMPKDHSRYNYTPKYSRSNIHIYYYKDKLILTSADSRPRPIINSIATMHRTWCHRNALPLITMARISLSLNLNHNIHEASHYDFHNYDFN